MNILEILDEYYKEYNEGLEEVLLGPGSSFAEPLKKLIGMGAVNNSKLHGEFFNKVKDAVEKYAEEQRETPSPEEAFAAIEKMLFYDREVMDKSILLGFMSAEGLAAPLVEFISSDMAADLSERYRKIYKPNELLPKQYELLKALTQKAEGTARDRKYLLRGKGELKSKKGLLGKRK